MIKDKDDDDWFYTDNTRAERYLKEKVFYNPDEKPPTVLSCGEFIKNILTNLD
jgi:hypothetical protein